MFKHAIQMAVNNGKIENGPVTIGAPCYKLICDGNNTADKVINVSGLPNHVCKNGTVYELNTGTVSNSIIKYYAVKKNTDVARLFPTLKDAIANVS